MLKGDFQLKIKLTSSVYLMCTKVINITKA